MKFLDSNRNPINSPITVHRVKRDVRLLEEVKVIFLEIDTPIFGEINQSEFDDETLLLFRQAFNVPDILPTDVSVLFPFQFLAFVEIPKYSLYLLEVVDRYGDTAPSRLLVHEQKEPITFEEMLSKFNMVEFSPEMN